MTETTRRGRGRGSLLLPDGRGGWAAAAGAPNAWAYTWGEIAARLCVPGPLDYRPSHLYLEFRNGGDPGDPVPTPPDAREDGLGYYLGLAGSADRDYLRIPISDATPGRDPDFEGTAHLPPGFANQVLFGGVSAEGYGVLGRPFSAAAGSRCYGSALAAAPFPGDPSRDVVWSRAYYAPGSQVDAPAGGAVRVAHLLQFR